MLQTVKVFDRTIAVVKEGSTDSIFESIRVEKLTTIFFCNVHMLMLSRENPALALAMDRATLVVPDGVPIAWLQRMLGCKGAEVLRGYEAMDLLCAKAAATGEPIGLLGSTETVLTALSKQLERRHPGLQIGFVHSPPFLSTQDIELDSSLVQEITTRKLRYLFVGLGCPKQEIWIDRYSSALNCTLLGVGAAFDWLAGTTPKPPTWMERSGLGWLYRLMLDPRRMWRRYFVYNTRFLISAFGLISKTYLR
jgi:N-acetylglucosaminyldiphosphoundecaprenol N-acetyl-beta-D-mannosaminyltransferase